MALSENEKKIAENICGKILVSKKDNISSRDISIIFDINEYGMVKSGIIGPLYATPRKNDVYEFIYETTDYVLDDIKNEFTPQINYLEDRYRDNSIRLFSNNSLSIVLGIENNKLKVLDNDKISSSYKVSKILPNNLPENTKVLLEKYSSDFDNVLKGLKDQLGFNKEISLVGARYQYAYNLAEQKSTDSYNVEDSSEKLKVIECFYNKLKQDFTTERLEKEEKELSKIFNQELSKVLEENRQTEINNEKILEDEKNRVVANNKILPSYEALKNKLLFRNFGLDSFQKIAYVDKNGLIEVNRDKTYPLSSRTFDEEYTSLDDYHVFEDEFKQENFEGGVYKYRDGALDNCIRLFKNDKYSLVMNFFTSNLDKYYYSIEENDKFENYYIKIKDKKYKDIIKKNSSINKIVTELNSEFDSNYLSNAKESLIYQISSNLAVEKGYSDFNFGSKYSLSLEKDLLNNFAVEYMKENNFSKKDVDKFYASVEEKLKEHKEHKEHRDIDLENNRKLNEIHHEEKIEKVVLKALNTLGIEFNNQNKTVRTSHRKPVELTDSTFDMLIKVSEGNPGAMNVLSKICNYKISLDMDETAKEEQTFENLMTILSLDDMNIRGSQIWILFNDVNGLNMDDPNVVKNKKFLDIIKKINKRDKKLIKTLNEVCSKHNIPDKAVLGGASDIMSNGKDASSLYFDNEIEKENE